MADLVELYTCKRCLARMFLRDCTRHFSPCWLMATSAYDAEPLKYYVRGTPNQHSVPGGNYQPPHQTGSKGRKGKPVVELEPEPEDLIDPE